MKTYTFEIDYTCDDGCSEQEAKEALVELIKDGFYTENDFHCTELDY